MRQSLFNNDAANSYPYFSSPPTFQWDQTKKIEVLTVDVDQNLNSEDRDQKLKQYREKREKRKYQGNVDQKRSKVAQTRNRDENGVFVKRAKTNVRDLEDKLKNSEDENRRLKEQLEAQQREMELLRNQMGFYPASENNNARTPQPQSYLEQYHDFRKRSELQKKMENEMSGSQLYMDQISRIDPPNLEKSFRFGGPPSEIFNQYPPWHNYPIPAFTEKVDFSQHQLRNTDSQVIDTARREHITCQKQQVNAQILNYGVPPFPLEEYHPASYYNPGDPISPKIKPAFSEKVDLGFQRTKLRRTKDDEDEGYL
jgi:hypothetical protein